MTQAQAIEKIAALIKKKAGDKNGLIALMTGNVPHPGQRRWVENAVRRENVLTCGNRWGKTEITGCLDVIDALTLDGWSRDDIARYKAMRKQYSVVNIAPTAYQAKFCWSVGYDRLVGTLGEGLIRDVKLTPFPRVEFESGSIFQARSTAGRGERLLGDQYDRISWDEAALEKKDFNYIRDNVLKMRTFDRRGRIYYVSTGQGRNEYGLFFLNALENPDGPIYAQTGPTYDNPYVPVEDLEEMKASMPERMFRQNVLGEIVDAGGNFFAIEDIEASISDELTKWNYVHKVDKQGRIAHSEIYVGYDMELGEPGVPWHNKYPENRYVHFWDLARVKDWVVGRTLDVSRDKMVGVEFERFNGVDWAFVYNRIRERHHRYSTGAVGDDGINGQSRTIVDSTGVGDVAVEALRDIAAEGFKFTGGMRPSTGTKDEILENLRSVYSLRELEMPMIPVEYDELKFYQREDEGIVQDCVMALAGAAFFGRRRKVNFAFDF